MNTVKPISPRVATRGSDDVAAADIDAAMAYERIFVPALFRHWPPHLICAADVKPANRTLDVACGTGVLTRTLPAVVGDHPKPVGLDISKGMLEVARQLCPDISWHHGDAHSLPFADAGFDRVFCQYGLMFFPDRIKALKEMARVLAPGGRLAFAVWDSLDNNPGFSEKVEILDRVAGVDAGDALRAPFCLGDPQELRQMAELAGLSDVGVTTVTEKAMFASLFDFVEAEVRGWLPVMNVHLPEDVIAAVHSECRRHLQGFETGPEGRLMLPSSAHVVAANAPVGRKSAATL